MSRLHIGLFNDSFPPTIDGVAQTVKNYAGVLHEKHCDVTVVTPRYRHVQDDYPYRVFRYPSIRGDRKLGYRVGNPFLPDTLIRLRSMKFDLMHVHAPFASSVLVNNINYHPKVPVVLTYHTKFDIDIAKRVHRKSFRQVAMRFLLDNINAADEVWVVTEGCGKSLRSIGYRGGYKVMENGTDFARGRANQTDIDALRETYHIPDDAFVFLFVGRMMWYKNVRIILDTLDLMRRDGVPFRAFLIGDGQDAPAIRQYAAAVGLEDLVIFTGAIRDRAQLRQFYSLADVFLFPSTYDTSGIVVKEAAACDCPSLLVRGSCAAEGAVHDSSAFLAEENAVSCAQVLEQACSNREHLREVGRYAGEHLYLSWEDAVARAYTRYTEILEAWPGPLPYNARSRWGG